MLFIPGLERIGSAALGSAAVTTGAITVPARDILLVIPRITGYSGSDIASLRFNGDSTVGNYTSSFITMSSGASPLAARVNNAGTLGHIPIASTGITLGRIAMCVISNNAATRKVVRIVELDEQSSTAAITTDISGGGVWLNTSAQITSIEMRTSGGGNTMNAGSGFIVYGANF